MQLYIYQQYELKIYYINENFSYLWKLLVALISFDVYLII